MRISCLWIEFSSFSLLQEKISAGYFNSPLTSKLLKSLIKCVQSARLRFSVSFSSDVNMLYFALLSMSPYLSTKDSIKCRRFSTYYSLLIDIAINDSVIYNMYFFFHFYLASFIKDNVYSFWTHGQCIAQHNRQYTVHFNSQVLSAEGFYDAYFFGVIDANLLYNVGFEVHFNNGYILSFIERLVCSLLCMPFTNLFLNTK
jgi:hypothetical protein